MLQDPRTGSEAGRDPPARHCGHCPPLSRWRARAPPRPRSDSTSRRRSWQTRRWTTTRSCSRTRWCSCFQRREWKTDSSETKTKRWQSEHGSYRYLVWLDRKCYYWFSNYRLLRTKMKKVTRNENLPIYKKSRSWISYWSQELRCASLSAWSTRSVGLMLTNWRCECKYLSLLHMWGST